MFIHIYMYHNPCGKVIGYTLHTVSGIYSCNDIGINSIPQCANAALMSHGDNELMCKR